MLREIYIVRDENVLYWISYGSALSWESLSPMLKSYMELVSSSAEDKTYDSTIVNFKVSYIFEKKYKILILFITDITDDEKLIDSQIKKARSEFVELFGDVIETADSPEVFKSFTPIADQIHRELRPKIALCGFSGVGKTTTTKLIRADEIPMEHVPTMTGEISTIKIGKLHFYLWDFAGQEQFSFLWPKFVKGSDAVILITDSTMTNIDKSKFFIDLVRREVPTARFAVVANKQDLPNALTPKEIADMLVIDRAYGMVAVDPKNRAKMISIIADVLKISQQISPLIKPLIDRDKIIKEAELALEEGNLQKAAENFESIAKYSMDLEEDKMAQEFFERARIIRNAMEKETEPAAELSENTRENLVQDDIEDDNDQLNVETPEEPMQEIPETGKMAPQIGDVLKLNDPSIKLPDNEIKLGFKPNINSPKEPVIPKLSSKPKPKLLGKHPTLEYKESDENISDSSQTQVIMEPKLAPKPMKNSLPSEDSVEPFTPPKNIEKTPVSLPTPKPISSVKIEKESAQNIEETEFSEKEKLKLEIKELTITLKSIEVKLEELDADLELGEITEKNYKQKKIELLEKESKIRKDITNLKIKLVKL